VSFKIQRCPVEPDVGPRSLADTTDRANRQSRPGRGQSKIVLEFYSTADDVSRTRVRRTVASIIAAPELTRIPVRFAAVKFSYGTRGMPGDGHARKASTVPMICRLPTALRPWPARRGSSVVRQRNSLARTRYGRLARSGSARHAPRLYRGAAVRAAVIKSARARRARSCSFRSNA
jgi:hypothetical protein